MQIRRKQERSKVTFCTYQSHSKAMQKISYSFQNKLASYIELELYHGPKIETQSS